MLSEIIKKKAFPCLSPFLLTQPEFGYRTAGEVFGGFPPSWECHRASVTWPRRLRSTPRSGAGAGLASPLAQGRPLCSALPDLSPSLSGPPPLSFPRRSPLRWIHAELTSPSSLAMQNSHQKEHLYKILVIGDLGVGKTSIIKRYVHHNFSPNYRATIGVDFALKVLNWDQETVRLQLWDIAGTAARFLRTKHSARWSFKWLKTGLIFCVI